VHRRVPIVAVVVVAAGLTVVAGVPAAVAAVKVPALIGDHMVVQAGQPVRLWGTAAGDETVRATLAGREATTKADAAGRWRVSLPAMPAGGPHVLVVQGQAPGSNMLRFTDVWAGEVWLASGQSNMEFPLWRATAGRDAARDGCAGMRLFTVTHATAATPRDDVTGAWQACDPEKAAAFSAVAFHFGRNIHRALGVPVGVIHASWGGTPAEAWTPRSALVAEASLRPMVDAFEQEQRDPERRVNAARALADWEARNFHQDTGNKGEARGFARADAPPAGWDKMIAPGTWEDAGLKIDGAVWFRREIDVPADWAGQDLTLSLGAIDDFDVSYWNGTRIGATGAETPQYWEAPRRYVVSGRLVRAGRNVIAVRIFDHYGSGGFAGPADVMTVRRASGEAGALPLAGSWRYRIEQRLKPIVADFNKRPRLPGADDSNSPTVLWNGMIAPVAGVPLAGVIWYQGESNVVHASQYATLFPTMIRAWRSSWGVPALPFLFVQLANFEDGAANPPLGHGGWAELREAQTSALRLPATGMAVTIDIGERDDIHPRNKHDVGRRLALAALAGVYRRDVIASGPRFHSAARAGATLRVRFTGVASGLLTTDGAPPKGFLLAGADRVWHVADAVIDGDAVMLSSRDVPEPVAARYAWGNSPPATLINQADLPAAPFRSDDWPAPAPQASAQSQ